MNALPHELAEFTDQELLTYVRKAVTRSVDLKKIQAIKLAASTSIGIRQGADMAKLELETLIDKYEFLQSKSEELDAKIDGLIDQIPGVPQMMAIKGIGRDTVAGPSNVAIIACINKLLHGFMLY